VPEFEHPVFPEVVLTLPEFAQVAHIVATRCAANILCKLFEMEYLVARPDKKKVMYDRAHGTICIIFVKGEGRNQCGARSYSGEGRGVGTSARSRVCRKDEWLIT
jgi:hypothetical protein